MSGTPNYLKAGDINRSTRSREIVNYLIHLVSERQIKPIMMKHRYCWSVHVLCGGGETGSEKVYCLGTCENNNIFGWPLNNMILFEFLLYIKSICNIIMLLHLLYLLAVNSININFVEQNGKFRNSSGSVMSRWNEANLQDMTIQDQWCPGEMKPINRIWLFSISDVQVKWSQFTGYDYSGTVMYRWNDEQCQSWIIGWVRDCSEISNWGRAIDFDGKSKRTLTFIHYENVRVCINVW